MISRARLYRRSPWWLLALAMPSAGSAYAADIAFAMADASGRQLLAPPQLAAPQAVRQALCPGNDLVNVRLLTGRRDDRPRGARTGSVSPTSHVFVLIQAEVGEDEACLLAPPEFFRAREPLLLETRLAREDDRDACSAELRARLAAAPARPVAGCWPLASLDEDDAVYVVLFANRTGGRSAALVLDHGGRLAGYDLPATAGDPSSAGRAGDGGFDPGAFDVLFVVTGPQGIELGVAWTGPAGSSLRLLQADGARLRTRLETEVSGAP